MSRRTQDTLKRVHDFAYAAITLSSQLLVDATPVPVEELDSLADAQQYIDQIEGLQATVLLKHSLIEELTSTNASLQTTIQQQAETIENLKKTKRNHRILIFLLVAAFVILALLAITYLIIHDAPNPHYGILPPYFAGETAGVITSIPKLLTI